MLKFKITTLLLVAVLATGLKAVAEEKTKEFHESWSASSVETLEVTNKFGEIKINNEGGNEVTIDVVVTVDAANEKNANDLLGKINVSIRKSGSTVKAVTTIEKNFKSQKKFSIDYVINIPSNKNLNISNKYGNTVVNELEANGSFNIQYGNLRANSLQAPQTGSIKVMLSYGNADISEASDLNVIVKYSNITLGEINDLDIESKYSVLDVEEGKNIKIESKYDKFKFEEVESITASTKYSHIRVEELSKSLKIEAGYGGVKISEIAPDFESVSITNSYGQISLGLDEANYSIDASCEYCGISYPEDEFTGDRMKENHTKSLKGKVGSGAGGEVYIRSRYGDIRLR